MMEFLNKQKLWKNIKKYFYNIFTISFSCSLFLFSQLNYPNITQTNIMSCSTGMGEVEKSKEWYEKWHNKSQKPSDTQYYKFLLLTERKSNALVQSFFSYIFLKKFPLFFTEYKFSSLQSVFSFFSLYAYVLLMLNNVELKLNGKTKKNIQQQLPVGKEKQIFLSLFLILLTSVSFFFPLSSFYNSLLCSVHWTVFLFGSCNNHYAMAVWKTSIFGIKGRLVIIM